DPTSVLPLGVAVGGKFATWRRVSADDLELTVPAAAPDAIDSVIELDFPGDIATNRARLLAAKGEPTALHVFDGKLAGKGIRYGDAKRGNDVINEWPEATGTVSWSV